MIESARFKSPIGQLSILAVKEGVVKISFENESREKMEKWFQSHLDMKIIEYFKISTETLGKRGTTSRPCARTTTPHPQAVWKTQQKGLPHSSYFDWY